MPLRHYHNYNKISNVFFNRDKKENEAPFNTFFLPAKFLLTAKYIDLIALIYMLVFIEILNFFNQKAFCFIFFTC